MDRYKFRGKRVDIGTLHDVVKEDGWVYGSLVVGDDGSFILESGQNVMPDEPGYHQHGMGCGLEDRGIVDRYDAMSHGWENAIEKFYECLPEFIEVHPDTVGQYTGLKDKNGVEDYAGNIWEVEYDGKKYRYAREVECEWEGYKFDFTNINHNLSPVHSDVSELGEIVGTIHDKGKQ